MARDAKPVLVTGRLNMDLVGVQELLPGTSQTVFGRECLLHDGGPVKIMRSNTI